MTAAIDAMTLTDGGVHLGFSSVQIASLLAPMAQTEASFGLRISATLSVNSVDFPAYIDTYGFGVGRTEVGLTTFSVEQPVSAATEQHLSALLVSRAVAQPH